MLALVNQVSKKLSKRIRCVISGRKHHAVTQLLDSKDVAFLKIGRSARACSCVLSYLDLHLFWLHLETHEQLKNYVESHHFCQTCYFSLHLLFFGGDELFVDAVVNREAVGADRLELVCYE